MPKSHANAKPSEPIKGKDKDKKERDKEKVNAAKKLEIVTIEATGSITAGSWVAEAETANIRKNTLRT